MFLFSRSISNERKKDLQVFQKRAGIRFKNLSLLDCAFKHKSSVKKHNDSNERLEFLGDSVLGLIVASIIFKQFQNYSEGDLARLKAAIVSEDSLAAIALDLHISEYLLLGKGEEMSGGKAKKAILADALEAIIGALYLDSGFKSVEAFVGRIIRKQLQLVVEHKRYEDFKSRLQEVAQRRFKELPKYTVEKTDGPDHDLTFWVSLYIAGKTFGPCVGKSKKDAEQEAAGLACKHFNI